ncbi:MAG: hypothetical protein LC118_03055 [Dehalococcoidia bacterium]|nr:hypothetical protein [Dehalococcoidia bacterium]
MNGEVAVCQVGSFLSRCQNHASHICQYCGRSFCPEHTHFLEGHEAVCSRKQCRAKRDDLANHLIYVDRVSQRNHVGLCGVEECGPHPGFQCSLCRGYFCGPHLHDRLYPFQEGRVYIDRPVSICQHCWDRRKIWRPR